MSDDKIVDLQARMDRLVDREKPKPSVASIQIPTLAAIKDREPVPRPWFYGTFLTAGAFLIVGRPKVGKSWLLMQLAMHAARGEDFLGFESLGAEQSLYIACEDDDTRIKTRAQCFGELTDRVRVITREQLRILSDTYAEEMTFLDFLRAYLVAHPMIKLVFIDTEEACRQIWGHSTINVLAQQSSPTRRDYAEVSEVDRLALELGVFIGLVNHAGKRKNGQVIDYHEMINRTNTAAGGASGSFVMADPPGHDPHDTESKTRIFAVRGRDLSKEHILAIEQPEGYSYFVSKGPYTAHIQTKTEQMILEELEGQPEDTWVTTRDLAEMVGVGKSAVQRCISRMMKAGRHRWKSYVIETKPKKGVRLIKMG